MLLNAAWTSSRGKRGDEWSFHLFPLIDLASGGDDSFQWQVLGGLLGRQREGSLHRWRLGYFWTDPSP